MKTAQLFDGTELQFPDDTSDEVIAKVAREQTLKKNQEISPPEKKSFLHQDEDYSKALFPKLSEATDLPFKAGVGVLDALSKLITGKSQEQIEKPYSSIKEALPDVARAAPLALGGVLSGGTSIPGQMAAQGALNAGSEGIASLLEGRSNKESLGNAADSGVISALMSAILPLGGKAIAKGMETFGPKLSGIDPNLYSKVLNKTLNGEEVFGQKSVLGKEKGNVFQKLKNMGDTEPASSSNDLIQKIQNLIENRSASSGVHDIDMPDFNSVQSILKGISSRENIPVTELDKLKNQLQTRVGYNKIEGKTKDQKFLEDVAKVFDEGIGSSSPELQAANKKYALSAQAEDAFNQFKPNLNTYQLGGLGAASGAAHLGGVPTSTLLGILSPIVLGSSPLANKYAIKGAGAVSRVYKNLPKNIIPALAAALSRPNFEEEDGTISPQAWKQAQGIR